MRDQTSGFAPDPKASSPSPVQNLITACIAQVLVVQVRAALIMSHALCVVLSLDLKCGCGAQQCVDYGAPLSELDRALEAVCPTVSGADSPAMRSFESVRQSMASIRAALLAAQQLHTYTAATAAPIAMDTAS
jgi:hypothetical protein